MILFGVFGVAASAWAQTSRPERPYRGLFGGGGTGTYTIGATGGSILTLSDGGSITIGTSLTDATQTISAPIVLGNAGGQCREIL